MVEGRGAFGIAVRYTAHRYLTRDEAADFETMEQKLPAGSTSRGLPGKAG